MSRKHRPSKSVQFFAVSCSYLLVACFSASPPKHCRSEEKTALLQFRSHLSLNTSSGDCNGPGFASWKEELEDCCQWDGISCNNNGRVVGLNIAGNCLYGTIPPNSTLFNLLHLEGINLNGNNFNNSTISPLFGRFKNLISLDLNGVGLSGVVPNEIFQIPNLQYLDLSGNSGLVGKISKLNSTKLSMIDLSGTSLTGELPDFTDQRNSLQMLSLGGCNFSGLIPASLGNLTYLRTLNLSSNHFRGKVPSALANLDLSLLDLSDNNLEGSILHLIDNYTQYSSLDLSRNNFTGTIDLKLFTNNQQLDALHLSNSGLSLTTSDSNFLAAFTSVTRLELSSCDLRIDNKSTNFLSYIQDGTPFYEVIDLSNNRIEKELHPSICKLYALYYLDLSRNQMSGVIPDCLVKSIAGLSMLNLGNNNFQGTIPESIGFANNLRFLDLSNNTFRGNIPRSLGNCSELEVLNLGGNRLTGSFPYWLGNLPSLKVLILRENRINGTITGNLTNKGKNFAELHIIDVSDNDLTGTLPSEFFENMNAMKVVDVHSPVYTNVQSNQLCLYEYCRDGEVQQYAYYYSLNIMNKGLFLHYQRVPTAMKAVDFSHNGFYGNIPPSIGRLKGIRALNFSGNMLTGPVPRFLGNLTNLDSLDLSRNMLSGEIPQDLSNLNFLGDLNLSKNNLTGIIPSKLDKFPPNSYGGNPGLCGLPLSRICRNPSTPNLPSHEKEDDFGWQEVWIGYGFGLVVGLAIGSFIPLGNKEWFVRAFNLKFVNVEEERGTWGPE